MLRSVARLTINSANVRKQATAACFTTTTNSDARQSSSTKPLLATQLRQRATPTFHRLPNSLPLFTSTTPQLIDNKTLWRQEASDALPRNNVVVDALHTHTTFFDFDTQLDDNDMHAPPPMPSSDADAPLQANKRTYQPSKIKRRRKHGFLKRLKVCNCRIRFHDF
jgi:hypothetical protein